MSTLRNLIQSDIESHFLGKVVRGRAGEKVCVTAVELPTEAPVQVRLWGQCQDSVTFGWNSHLRRPSKGEPATARPLTWVLFLVLMVMALLLGYELGFDAGARSMQPPDMRLQFGVPNPKNVQ